MLELMRDIVGFNRNGNKCHPYKHVKGPKQGRFSFTLSNDNRTFEGISESELRARIENGDFNGKGRIRMVPHDAVNTMDQGALRVRSYKGAVL